jgi:hypothetical protein
MKIKDKVFKVSIDDQVFELHCDDLMYLQSCLPYFKEVPKGLWPLFHFLDDLFDQVLEEEEEEEDEEEDYN